MRTFLRYSGVLVCLALPAVLDAAVIGKSTAAESITAERIAALPAADRAAWMAYLARSQRQEKVDRAALAAELAAARKAGSPDPPLPQEHFAARSMPLDRESGWYGGAEARHTADVILSFQTPAGGWSKNLDMSGSPRLPGQSYTTDNLSKHLSEADFDAPRDPQWNYVGTLDNDATSTQLHFLAMVALATPGVPGEPYRASFLRGVEYLLAAQFPNGGSPQVWPLEGGYHDAITYNDDAVTKAAALLSAVAGGEREYGFVPATIKIRAGAAASRALACILRTQIVVNGHKTVWAQQHDALTLAPVAGRNFEPAALSSGESAELLQYLMSLPHPSAAVRAAVDAAVDWLREAAIYGQEWIGGRGTEGGRHVAPKDGAGPIWARYYSLTTGKPIFGDRDKTIHDEVNELSLERRNGYAWYSVGPEAALAANAVWRKTNGLK